MRVASCHQTHPWFVESAISGESLRADLLARKAQVEEEKRKEREQKRLNASKDDGEEFDPFAANVSRSVASSIVSEPGAMDVHAPLYPKESVAVYTSFQTKRAPVDVQARLEMALQDMSAVLEVKHERFKTKATLPKENVGFVAHIYSLLNVSAV